MHQFSPENIQLYGPLFGATTFNRLNATLSVMALNTVAMLSVANKPIMLCVITLSVVAPLM